MNLCTGLGVQLFDEPWLICRVEFVKAESLLGILFPMWPTVLVAGLCVGVQGTVVNVRAHPGPPYRTTGAASLHF